MTFADRISKAFAKPGFTRAALPLALVAVGAIVAVAVPKQGDRRGGNRPANLDRRGGPTVAGGDLAIAAAYLHLSGRRLRQQLRSGRTLAEVANSSRGTSAGGLIDAILAARRAGLAKAVGSGRLTRADERASLSTLAGRVAARVERVGGYGLGGGPGGSPDLLAAARYLGVPPQRLRGQLRSGRTLAELASATGGRSAAGLTATLIAQRRSRLDATVVTGGLSRSRARELLASLEKRVRAEVARRR